MDEAYFIGIDIGTQGARITAADARGRQVAVKEEVFALTEASRREQDPDLWWLSCRRSLNELCKALSSLIDRSLVKAIGVTSTSGTIIPLNKNNRPLHPAIMYSDDRSAGEAQICSQAALQSGTKGYTAFNTSSGLPKMLWFLNKYPQQREHMGKFIHASDFITGTLTGNFGLTDYTNALKSGYDLHQFCWPDYISSNLKLHRKWLQEVAPSGKPAGRLHPGWAYEFGLNEEVIVTVGLTDGCASQVASGAVHPGDWNTTIGTTLVIKGVTENEVIDPSGAVYCHRHPEGYWMPGGASNTGADWISSLFPNEDLNKLGRAAADLLPGRHLAWPLQQKGERFPFMASEARGFGPAGVSKEELFTANMEGVAYMERYAFDKIRKLSGAEITRIFSAGGGSNSDVWLKIRSAVLNLPVYKMQNVSGAAGAAIVAASMTHFKNIREAADKMIRPEKIIGPESTLVASYEERYRAFVQLLKEKGYVPGV